ncbi:hypothetical protein [Bartonella sp. LJL80]
MMKSVVAAFFLSLVLPLYAVAEEDNTAHQPHDAVAAQTTQAESEADIANPPDGAMQFSLINNDKGCASCRWISAQGDITPETPAAFSRFMADNHLDNVASYQSGLTLALHSNGGDILAAIALGRDIRRRGLDTTIEQVAAEPDKEDKTSKTKASGMCKEACLWAFFGGRARNADSGVLEMRTYRPPLDEAGTTSGQEVDVRKQQLADIAYISDYAREMGFDPAIAFIDWEHADPHIYTEQEKTTFRLGFSPDMIGRWQLVPADNALSAVALSDDQKTTARLYCDMHKTTFLEISGPTRYDAASFDNYRQAATKMDLWGMGIPITDLQFNYSEGRIVYSLKLPKTPPQNWRVDAPYLNGIQVPQDLKGAIQLQFSDMAGLKQAAQFVVQNCPRKQRR